MGSEAVATKKKKKKKKGLIAYAVSDISRLGKITSVLVRHGFGQITFRMGLTPEEREAEAADPSSAAERFRSVLEELGPTFVKLGQVLSTRPDLLPAVYIDELSKLQDQSPPLDFDIVRTAIETSLDEDLDDIFAWFRRKPLATGSIAQTHLASLKNGREVVVKVQRPGLEEVIRSDLDLLRILSRVLEATIEEMGLYAPTDIVAEFERALRTELDFTIEAGNIALFRELLEDRPEVWIPETIDELCTREVLVLERIPGVKVTEIEPNSERAKKLAIQLLDLAYTMLFETGVFHGDPHPGNMLITDDDRIGLIDFGLIGRLSQRQQDVLVALIISIVSGDIDGIARSVMQLGRPQGRVPLRDLHEDIVSIRSRYLKSSLGDVDLSQFVLELLEAGQRYRISVPADYAILTKASVSMEGIIRHLYPEIDIPSALAPYSRKLLLQRYGPQRLSQSILTTALNTGGIMRDLPVQISQLLMDLEYDGLRVKVENQGLAEMRSALNLAGTKVALGAITAGLVIATAISVETHGRLTFWGGTAIGLATLFSVLILWWHFIDGRIRKVRITPLLKLMQRARGD